MDKDWKTYCGEGFSMRGELTFFTIKEIFLSNFFAFYYYLFIKVSNKFLELLYRTLIFCIMYERIEVFHLFQKSLHILMDPQLKFFLECVSIVHCSQG